MIGILARFLRSTMVNRLLLMRRNVSLHGLPGSRQMAALREVGETESVRPGPFAPFTGEGGGSRMRGWPHRVSKMIPNTERKLVLPSGIEPPTSPLPRVCSTTELRQQDQIRASRGSIAGTGRLLPQLDGKRKQQIPTSRGLPCKGLLDQREFG